MVIDLDRLTIRAVRRTGRTVAYVTHRDPAVREALQVVSGENLIDKTEILFGGENTVVVHNDPAALLSAVL